MMGDGGDFFWILTAVTGVITVGGGLAISLVRDSGPADEDGAARRSHADGPTPRG